MKLLFFIFSLFLPVAGFAQNFDFSCDNADFQISGLVIEDAHGYVFEVRNISFLEKGTAHAIPVPVGSSVATSQGRRIKFVLPDGRSVTLELFDHGDDSYARGRGRIEIAGSTRDPNLVCAATSSP